MRPLKIAVLRSKDDSSYRVRCHVPLSWLQKQRAIEIIPPLRAWEADVVLLHDQWQPGVLAVARSLQRHGIRVVANFDESVPNADGARCLELLEAVDAVFVPTEDLSSKLAALGSKAAIVPNGIDLEAWRRIPKQKARDRVQVVGFAGAVSENANLEILRPVLAKLSGRFKEHEIRFVCFGARPSWLSGIMAGAEVVEACDPDAYPFRLATLGFDIALAPLSNSSVDKSRAALKFWEYTAAGAVTVASNVDPHDSAIQDGITGLLVDKQPEAWMQAILRLIKNHELRAQLLQSAERSLEQHDVSRTAPAMLAAFESTQPNRRRELFSFPRTQNLPHPDVDVVIPIYNSPELTRQAIEAVLPELDAHHRLILVDDASPDPAVGTLLDEYAARPWVTVHRSARNLGFVATCNLAVRELVRPDADVILLNSDTRPMPGFVRRLAESAGSNPAIGTVTAASNQGWIASVPDFADAKDLAALEHPLVLSPTACGFLFYVKREVLRKYGLFDPAFSPGYCEEVDLSQRISPEYVSVMDPGCWTWHANSVSFGDTKYKLSADHNAMIDQRYPNFRFELAAFQTSDPLRDHRMNMLRATRDPRPRILHVLQSIGSTHGTGKHVHDLSGNLSDQFLSLSAAPNEAYDPAQEQLQLSCGEVTVGAWQYSQPGWPQTATQLPANEEAWTRLIDAVKPNVIHLHHAKNHTLSLLPRLTATGIPVIVSIHDYFFLCPDFALQQCPGLHGCDTCYPMRFKGPAQYQHLRRALYHASLKQAVAIIAPSQTAAGMVREVYPDLNIQVIPHGICAMLKLARQPGSKVRFGMIGNVNAVKGIEIILQSWPLVTPADGAELHVFGESTNPAHIRRCAEVGIHYHGPYAASDLPQILSQIDVGVLPSQAPETFSYALSEFFAGGVPVIGSDFGALSERIENGVNGFKIVKDDVRSWASVLSRLIQDRPLRDRIRRGVVPPESVSDMSAHYANLYRDAIANAGRRLGANVQAPLPMPSHGIAQHAARL